MVKIRSRCCKIILKFSLDGNFFQWYTGISKEIEYHGKGQYFLSLISESETYIFYRFITQRVKYFKHLFLEILMIMTDNKNPKFSVSEN